jgi:hypothetical protein
MDHWLGHFMERFNELGLHRNTVVVLLADHGVSFRPREGRRQVTESNLVDIANVPLLVKRPGQRRARVDLRAAQTVDVVPTIADVLGIRVPWKADGASLLGPARADREVVIDLRGGKVARPSLAAIARDRAALVRWKIANFGQGRESLYEIGTNRWLLGRALESVRLTPTSVTAKIENSDQLASVDRRSGFVPVRIFGSVRSGTVGPSVELAVSVNGRIRALTRVFGPDQEFRAFVPEASLREGPDEVEVFLVHGTRDRVSLARIAST